MNGDWMSVLVPLAPFVVLAIFVVLALRRGGDDRRELVRFGRQGADASQQIAAMVRENNALLRTIAERLDRLEKRERQ